jgi:hypothetical protein
LRFAGSFRVRRPSSEAMGWTRRFSVWGVLGFVFSRRKKGIQDEHTFDASIQVLVLRVFTDGLAVDKRRVESESRE